MNHYTIKQIHALSKMLEVNINRASHQAKKLHGGTLGDVWLVTGMAETSDGGEVPYKTVLKIQKKWERPGDPCSWRREYDLYESDLNTVFTDALRWPECYHAEIIGDEIQIWMEYIEGISGGALTIEALEHAAEELGRFQGRLYKQPEALLGVACLGDAGFMEREYGQWKPETVEYRYLYSDECTLPEHLRRMLIDIQQRADTIFADLKRLPVVLCHRDFWIENIFLSDGKLRLIDWDCTGWGFLGEDIASLIVDETDAECLGEYCHRLIPAYHRGLYEYMDISTIEDFYIQEMIVIKFGYRILQKYMFSKSSDVKNQQITLLQGIYDMKDGKGITRTIMKGHD